VPTPWKAARGRAILVTATALLAGGVATGCDLQEDADLDRGRSLFSANCGTCHTLAEAGTTATVGPDLDAAFAVARADGMDQDTIEGVVSAQIENPRTVSKDNPRYDQTFMPAEIVTGRDAEDVAAYVASAVSKSGEDKGQLAAAGVKRSTKVAKAQGGKLAIPADPSGTTLYQFGSAQAPAGPLEIDSENKSSTDHDIAIEGNGVSEKGEVVKNGGVSKLSADLKPGEYTFFCSVPGHREGGMEGKLTVK
jgi:mono/diheme cytochrome c family protein